MAEEVKAKSESRLKRVDNWITRQVGRDHVGRWIMGIAIIGYSLSIVIGIAIIALLLLLLLNVILWLSAQVSWVGPLVLIVFGITVVPYAFGRLILGKHE